MFRRRSTLVFTLCLFVGGLALGQDAPAFPRTPLIVAEAALELAGQATPAAYPDADLVVVADYTKVAYEPDGSSMEWSEGYTKVMTEKGKRDAGSLSFRFMAHYGRVEILLAEIIRPDGGRTVVDVAAQSREMVDSSQMGSNIFDPNQKLVTLTIPGIELGDVIRLAISRTTFKARVPNTWADYQVFEYQYPILSLVYEIHAPSERPLAVVRLRDEIPGTMSYAEERQDRGTLHRWTVRNVPQAFPEPNMPEMHTVVQRLLVSTIADWREISRWYWKLCEPRLETTTEAMRAEVDKLVEGAQTWEERVRRIFTFVSQRIRYMGITPEDEAPGYEPHDVSMTFENRYGVCRDKAALLVAMLRMADIQAYPVIIHAGPRKDSEVPQPFFNHAVVAVEREGIPPEVEGADRYLLMDPTDENTRDLLPGNLRNKSFLVAHPEGETLLDSGPNPVEENLVRIRTSGVLDANDTLTLDTEIAFEGVNDNAYRNHFSRLKPEERRRFFEGLVRAQVAGAMLTEFTLLPEDLRDTEQPLVASLRSVSPDYPVAGAGAWVIGLPWFSSSVGYANWVIGRTGLSRRRFPLDTDPTCGVEETITLELGSRFAEPRVLPDRTRLDSEGLFYEQQILAHEGTLSASVRFHVRSSEFSPGEYLELRDHLKEIEFSARRRPIYDPPLGPDENDATVLLSETRIELESARAWTSLTRNRTRILTYAGKKANSELKLGFNPAWQTVEVLEARVTAPDGTLREVEAHERNLMDAAWVGGAPRYPAERTLVVSLPGVEVGSVIETLVKRTQKHAPFFSMNHVFQGFDPIEVASLEISCPSGLALSLLEPESTPALSIVREFGEEQGVTRLRWSAANVPALRRDDNLPPAWAFLPTVFASSGDWEAYGADLSRRIRDLASNQPSASLKAAELVQGVKSERERILAIRDFVARSVRVAGPDFTVLPLDSWSPADVTLRDGYGHRTDQAILMLAMLEAVGVPAAPVLVAGGSPVLPSVLEPLLQCPQRSLFNTLLVRAEMSEGDAVLLNDTDHYAELGTTPHELQPCLSLDGTQGFVELSPLLRTRSDREWLLEVAVDGSARITEERRYHGTEVNAFRRQYREMPPEERSRHHQEMVASVSQAAEPLGDLFTDLAAYPGIHRMRVQVPRYAVREQGTLHLLLPGLEQNLLGLRSERRAWPLYRGRESISQTRHTVLFPASATKVLAAPPARATFDFPGGFGVVTVETGIRRLEDGQLEVTLLRKVGLQSAVASPDLYPALLAMNRQLQHPRFRTLLVEMGVDQERAAD